MGRIAGWHSRTRLFAACCCKTFSSPIARATCRLALAWLSLQPGETKEFEVHSDLYLFESANLASQALNLSVHVERLRHVYADLILIISKSCASA